MLKQGDLFNKLDACYDEDAHPNSDMVHFKDGLKWAYVATEWERAK